MAAPEKRDGPGFPVAIVATVLVALAGLIVGQWQLVGMRPPASEVGSYPPGPLQDVPGRPWQDPFGVIDQHLKRVKSAPSDQDSPRPVPGSEYPLILVFGLSAGYAATCAFKLRHVAERARHRALDRFTYLLVNAKGEGGSPALAGQIETMIREIQSLHHGAFAPFTEQPVVRALLLPISSVGGMSLVLHDLGWGDW